MNELIELISEGFRLVKNLGKLGHDWAKSAIMIYFRKVRLWTIRFAIAAALPLVVIIPCFLFKVELGGLYGAYVVWVLMLLVAEMLMLTPMIIVLKRLRALLPGVEKDIIEWLDFIKSVLFNGLSLGIFITLFPVWRSPGALPLLLLVLVCWLMLPMSGINDFLKRIYPAIRAVQLLILFGILILQIAFPIHLEQLRWTSSRAIGIIITQSVQQKELTSEWENITWFNNVGEPNVWYSGSDKDGFQLWATPGFDPRTGIALKPVSDNIIQQNIFRHFTELDLVAKNQQKIRTEEQRLIEQKERELTIQKQQSEIENQRIAQFRIAEKAGAERRASYLRTSNLPNKVDFIVSAATVEKQPMDSFAMNLVKYLQDNGRTASNIVFTPTFITQGAFDNYFNNGGGEDLRMMPLSSMGDQLLLARVKINSVKRGTQVSLLYTASVSVDFSILSSDDGNIIKGFSLIATGPGTSESSAITAGLERILDQLSQYGY